tara:strand:+ start:8721 stop:9572 length:852 start_codon:yes stop_codon:yes gene_type:complete
MWKDFLHIPGGVNSLSLSIIKLPFLSYCVSNTTSFLDNIKDKKVLVLGSGPSATEIDWANKDWDILVTTSFFYLVPEILEQKPVHITLSNIVNLEDKRLLDYLDNNPHCTIGFELEVSGKVGPLKDFFFSSELYLNFEKRYKDRIVNYRITRAYNNIKSKKDKLEWNYLTRHEGTAGRLCWAVLSAKPKSLTICGIDGVSKTPEKDPPNYFRGYCGTPDWGKNNDTFNRPRGTHNYSNYKLDFEGFGEKLYTIGHKYNIPIYNLGKGKPYNMITPISEKYEKS